MARDILTVQEIVRTGLNPSLSAGDSANGHEFVNDGKTYVEVVNGGGSPIVVTIPTPGSIDGLAIADRTVSVPAGETRKIGPFPNTYNQSGGLVYIDLDDDTSVTLGAFKLR